MATASQAAFLGFQFPNTTQIPNEVFDALMPHLSGGELKVLLYICRRTFGFRKDKDSISLTQIAHGITTKAGRVLDQGTGLSKRQVQRALRVLESRKVILVERKVDETGLHEINTYRLNVRGGDNMSPPVETPGSGGVGTSVSPGVETSASTTKQREQNKETQKKDLVDVVAQDLENFGMTTSAITKLVQDYPAVYIREKLEMAKGLVAAGSCLVSQNPAGWLRKAIEEDYSSPRTAARYRQRSVREKREKKDATLVHAEPRATSDAARDQEEAGEQAQTVATEPEQGAPTHNRENIPEKKAPEKTNRAAPDAARENETTWNKTLEKLKEYLPAGETDIRFKGTTLLQVTDTAARIAVPSASALVWLERRLYQEICNALKGVLGKDLDLQFVSAP
jgi:phage replication O-like protein O